MANPTGKEPTAPSAGVEAPIADAPTALTPPAAPLRPSAGNALVPSEPVTYRDFNNVDATRKAIFGNVVKAIQTKYPIENQRYKLELTDVKYKDEKPFSLAEQKTAIMRGQTLQHQLTGTWRLTNKEDGKVVDEKSGVVAHVPYLTNRGTFIYGGSEYTINNQMRLKPGVYSRVKENGILEAHFNSRPGTGPSFRLYMEPDTGIFRAGVGQSELKLYPILRAMGVPDADIEKHWGKELLQKNMEAADPRAVSRAFAKLVYTRADANAEARKDDDAATEEAEAEEQEKAAEQNPHVVGTCVTLPKEAQIGRDISNRKWRYLWQTGKLRSTDTGWVLLDVHKGLCESAYHNLKVEGVECEPHFDNPHISVLNKDEVEELKEKYGFKWEGVAKIGQPFKFYLKRMVDLVPHAWDGMDRVWFLEVESPQLRKFRKSLGFPELPKNSKHDYDMRFHITFAVHRSAKKAAELFTEQRANYGVGDGLLDGYEEFKKAAAKGELIELFQKRAASDDTNGEQIKQVFDKIELDPDVTKMTLGQAHSNAGSGAILRASQKLLNISRGHEEVDDRDSLAFQQFHGPEDFFAERINKDAGQAGRKLLWKATLRGNLKHVPSGALTPQIHSVLLRSGLGQALEEINPFEVLDQQLRVVRTGEGGIGSMDAVPMESRNVQPSHFGYIDPVRSPESEAIGIDSRVTHGTMKGSDGKIYTRMINAKTGKTELVPADKAAHSTIAFPGEMERGGKRVRAMVKAHQVEFVGPQDVDYVLPHHSQMFTSGSNLVPLISGSKAGRLLMGAKFINQALALEHPEEPLVQNLSQSGKSFDELYGENVGAIRAKQPGVVTGVSNEHVSVKYADGTTQDHELYHNFPFNRKSLLHNTPTVKIGDPVKPGTLLAKSNYTNDKGTMAVGHNLRVAYMPYRGLNYEDASVVSESAAKAMASEHMYQNTLSDPEGTMDIGRKQFLSLFPGKFKPNQIENIGEDGTIKPGTKVKKGDPLVLALNRTQIDAVHRGRKPMFTDSTVTWDHESDGVVTDVEPMKEGGFNVIVKAYSPVQEGDKLCFDPATSVLTKSGWKPVAELTFKDEVATLSASGELEYQYPSMLMSMPYEGKMYYLNTKHVNMLVTPEHRLWVARPGQEYEAISAASFYSSKGEWQFKKDCKWKGIYRERMEFESYVPRTNRTQRLSSVLMNDWLEFLGYYVSEGACFFNKANGGHQVRISQSRKSPHWGKIEAVLRRLGLRWSYNEKAIRFEITSIWLYGILYPLGDSLSKYVPGYVQELCPDQLLVFLTAYLDGDGHRGAVWEFGSSSNRLAEDIQVICLKLGWAVSLRETNRIDNWQKHPHWRGRINKRHLRPWWKKSRTVSYASVKEEMVDYTGKVYCLRVPNHVVYVKREDKTYWSHNCGRYG